MKLKDLKSILYSKTGMVQWAVVYNAEQNKDENYCTIDYAVATYGECEVKRISSYYDVVSGNDYLVITI